MADESGSSKTRRRIRAALLVLILLIIIILLWRCGPGSCAPEGDVSAPPPPPGGVESIAGLPSGAPGSWAGPGGADRGPGFAEGDVAAGPRGLAGGARPARASGRPVGEVAALLESATAQRAGAAPRSIGCGDLVYEGERLVTPRNARVGILSDDAYVQLDSDSSLQLGLTPEEALDLELHKGRVRVVDSRERGSPGRLRVDDAETGLIGNDVEAYALGEPGEGGILCSRNGPLAVSRNGSMYEGTPGGCVVAKAGGSLAREPTPAARVSLPSSEAEECPVDWTLGPALLHFSPVDVAAGPDRGDFFPIVGLDGIERTPCDNPGGLCGPQARSTGSGPEPPGSDPPGPKPPKPPHPPKPLKGIPPFGHALGPYVKGPPPGIPKVKLPGGSPLGPRLLGPKPGRPRKAK